MPQIHAIGKISFLQYLKFFSNVSRTNLISCCGLKEKLKYKFKQWLKTFYLKNTFFLYKILSLQKAKID